MGNYFSLFVISDSEKTYKDIIDVDNHNNIKLPEDIIMDLKNFDISKLKSVDSSQTKLYPLTYLEVLKGKLKERNNIINCNI
jgi:hypothetical protein